MLNIMQKRYTQGGKARATLPLTTVNVETTTRRKRRKRCIKNKGGEDFDTFAQVMCIGRCLTVGLLGLG